MVWTITGYFVLKIKELLQSYNTGPWYFRYYSHKQMWCTITLYCWNLFAMPELYQWVSNVLLRRCPLDLAVALQLCISISSPVCDASRKQQDFVGAHPLTYASAKYFLLLWLPFGQLSCNSLSRQVQRAGLQKTFSYWGLALLSLLR